MSYFTEGKLDIIFVRGKIYRENSNGPNIEP